MSDNRAQAAHTPPPGTYPPPDFAQQHPGWQPPPPPAPEPRPKRVGHITVAVALIAFGVLMVLRALTAGLDYGLIAQLSPLILVVLGIEVLATQFLCRDRRIRFDLLSVFVCLLLIGGSLAAALVPEALLNEQEAQRVGNRLSAELESESYSRLSSNTHAIYSVEWYVSVHDTRFDMDMQIEDITPEQYAQVRVRFGEDFASSDNFAQAVRDILDDLADLVPYLDYASFYSFNYYDAPTEDAPCFAVWLDNSYQIAWDATRITGIVNTEYADSYEYGSGDDSFRYDHYDDDNDMWFYFDGAGNRIYEDGSVHNFGVDDIDEWE